MRFLSFLLPAFLALIACTTLPVASAAANPSAASANLFQYVAKQPVTIDPAQPFFIVELSPEAYAGMDPALRDLRLFADGQELGYARMPEEQPKLLLQKTEQPLTMLNQGELADGSYSFTMVLPRSQATDSLSLRIRLDQAPYLVKGTLYGSQDNRNWQRLRPVTLFALNNQISDISLAGIDYEYLKIDFTQPPGDKLQPKEAVLLRQSAGMNSGGSSLDSVPFSLRQDASRKETLVSVDLQARNRISSELILGTEEKGFYRTVFLEGSHDGEHWQPIESSYLYRGVEAGDENLSLAYSPRGYRYLRLRIANQDNQPLAVDNVKIRTHPVRVIAKAPSSMPGTSFAASSFEVSAYWGSQTIPAPSYDVSKVADRNLHYPLIRIVQWQENPDYQPAAGLPLSERFPWLLPSGLLLAALAVSYLLYRNLKQIQ
jgi:hypothetical protein